MAHVLNQINKIFMKKATHKNLINKDPQLKILDKRF